MLFVKFSLSQYFRSVSLGECSILIDIYRECGKIYALSLLSLLECLFSYFDTRPNAMRCAL
jgi:hypothetical protein